MIGNPRKALTLFAFHPNTVYKIPFKDLTLFPSLLMKKKKKKLQNQNSKLLNKTQSDTNMKKMFKIPFLSLTIWLLFLISPLSHSLSHALQGNNLRLNYFTIKITFHFFKIIFFPLNPLYM